MLSISPSIAILTLVITILAKNLVLAFPQPEQSSGTISLPSRTLLVNADGSFNHEKAVVCNAATALKYRRNLMILQENNGGVLPEGMKFIDVPQSQIQTRQEQWQDEESLTDENDDSEWAVLNIIRHDQDRLFTVGKRYNPRTGSSDLWVPSSLCDSTSCSGKRNYNSSLSSTSQNKTGVFSIQYGDGSTVSGPIYSDTITVAGVKVQGQEFAAVTNLSSSFASDPVDGVFGLGFPSISNLKADPFFVNAAQQNALLPCHQQFRAISRGTNPKFYNDPIEYHSVDKSNGFWQVKNASVAVGGQNVLSDFDTIIDSGTTIMYGPPDMVKEIYAKVEGATIFDSDEGFYSFPCDKVPDISFSWGGENFAISSENLNLGRTALNATTCAGALAAKDLGLGNTLLLGDSWMKNAYHVFSLEKTAVGFAKLK
ncbi:acid protease [Lentinula guzmanii]|uniref:Acid protease n=1 Tax=Lentinula guzmanii TaxID=2804957 RepID=A0AA38MWQ7_9AGAR|nr:acid protease [Lentinula guzmanii]